MISGTELNKIKNQLINAIKNKKTPKALEIISQLGDKSNFWFKMKNGAAEEQTLTPLHFAAQKGATDVVQALLVNGSLLNSATKNCMWKRTPLHLAIHSIIYRNPTAEQLQNLVSTIKLMVKTDPSIRTIPDGIGYTAVHRAATSASCSEVLEFFLSYKENPESELLDPNIPNSRHKSMPLHYAAKHHNYPAVVYLMEHGANPNYRDKENKSPYELACKPEIKAYIKAKSFPSLKELCARALYAGCTLEENSQQPIIDEETQIPLLDVQEIRVPEPIFEDLLVLFKKFTLEKQHQEDINLSLPLVEKPADDELVKNSNKAS